MNTPKRMSIESFAESLFISEAEREHFEERAAIMEYEAGLPREEAEKRALESVIRCRGEFRRAV